ncbi:MAG: hypothetical protein R3D65_09630 [Zhengella sp.]|uniref:hypothetical protein n=1 Tax=Zhengella sp. TaxID=2282762 RepID=UPI003529AFE3
MRMVLAICLAFVFMLAHPGVPGEPALARQAETAAATTAKDHAHREGPAVETAQEHPCCPGMAGVGVTHGKASHCSIDGGFVHAYPVGLVSSGPRIQVSPFAQSLQEADPGAILHPPMSV